MFARSKKQNSPDRERSDLLCNLNRPTEVERDDVSLRRHEFLDLHQAAVATSPYKLQRPTFREPFIAVHAVHIVQPVHGCGQWTRYAVPWRKSSA